MGEFTFMEDWDLQAVMRGSCTSNEAFTNIMNNPSQSLFAPPNLHQDELLSFTEIFEPTTDLDGPDQEVYKPAFYQQQDVSFQSRNLIMSTTSSMSIPRCEVKELPEKQHLSESALPASGTDATMAAKSKRRKNQQKRVVKHVAEDGLSSDMWAWRKYGQKPIKGSPYPRSYYRCSSSRGCLARKQVERSSSDPSMFIITYAEEHSHAHPTRRSSLAGSTRIKSSTAKQAISNEPILPIIKDECLDGSHPSFSAISSMAASTEDELVQNVRIKNEEVEDSDIVIPDMIFSDDLFPSFEDFEGLLLDHQFAATFA